MSHKIADRMEISAPKPLRPLKGWLLWRYEGGANGGKPRKVPYYVNGKRRYGMQGSSEDRTQLACFEKAHAAYQRGGYEGLGLAMLPEWELVGLDFDKCIHQNGRVEATVLDLLSDTYVEKSPSGTGLRAFMRGALADR